MANVNDALKGSVGTPSDTNRYRTQDDPAGVGTVTSVATTAPITGGPITTTGTIGVSDFVGSGASHARGTVPDPGATPGTAKFLREDATFAVPPGTATGTVTSVAQTVPAGFSVGGSPVTGAGTLAITLDNQTANKVLASATSGGAATPAFRALVAADLPATAVTPGSYTNTALTVDQQGRLTAASSGTAPVTSVGVTAPIASTGGTTPTISLNDTAVTPATYTNATLTVDQKGRLTSASSGTAPVTSVGVTAPLTTTGGATPSLGMVNQGTTTTVLHGNAAGNPTFGAVVDADLSGTIGVPHGGTGLATLTNHALQVGAGTSSPTQLTLGTSTTVLHGAAAGDPTWGVVSLTADVGGTLAYGNGGTGATALTNHGVVVAGASALSTVAPGSSGNVLTSNGTDWTSAAASGGFTGMTSGQVPYATSATAGTTEASNFKWDSTNKRLGVGTDTPGVKVQSEQLSTTLTALQNLATTASSNPTEITIQNNIAYVVSSVGGSVGGFDIIDVSNPSNMILRSHTSINNSNSQGGLVVNGRYLYFAAYGLATVYVYDVYNVASPALVGSIAIPAGAGFLSPVGMIKVGKFLFVGVFTSSGSTGQTYAILDVADPSNPLFVNVGGQTSFSISNFGRVLAYTNGLLLVADLANTKVMVVNVINPLTRPVIVGSVAVTANITGTAQSVARGNYVFCTDGARVYSIKVSTTTAPVVASTLTVANAGMLKLLNNYLFVVQRASSSIAVVDVSNPESLSLKTTITTATATKVAIDFNGSTMFLTDDTGNLLSSYNLGALRAMNAEIGSVTADTVRISGDLQAEHANFRGNLDSGGLRTESARVQRLTVVPPADLSLSTFTSREMPDVDLVLARTSTFDASVTNQRAVRLTAPTYAGTGALTLANAASLGISGAPIKGTNAALTRTYGLLIGSEAVSTAGTSYGALVNQQSGATANFGLGVVGAATAATDHLLALTNTSTGDAQVSFGTALGTAKWTAGLDNSTTNDDFAIALGGSLGTTNALSIDGSSRDITTGAALSVQGRVNLKRTTFSDAAYGILTTDNYVAQIGTMTASRALTLPSASGYGAGGRLMIADESGSVTVANTIVITRAGSDTINGATTNTIVTAYGTRTLISDGTSKWTVLSSL